MAQLVMGLGTSHGSQVSLTPDRWREHGELDRKRTPYDELLKAPRPDIQEHLVPEVMEKKYQAAQDAVAQLGSILRGADLDAVIVVGDDQGELFAKDSMPAVALYWGAQVLDIPRDMSNVPPSRAAAMWAKHATTEEAYPVPTGLGQHVVRELTARQFDPYQMTRQPSGQSIGHAFTFVRLRLMGTTVIPILPVLLNTYFPPNQPTAARCLALGEAIGEAVAGYPEDLRIGMVASGGLSHFVVDEELDNTVLRAIQNKDHDTLAAIPEGKLQSGSSEIKNWMVTAAALRHLDFAQIDYIPGYRSVAGTGCGMAFGCWS